MTEKVVRQTSIRVEEDVLRKARYFLDEEHLSVNDFVARSLKEYVAKKEAATTERRTA